LHDPDSPALGVFVSPDLGSRGEDWKVKTDAERRRADIGSDAPCTPASERQATLRRIGWLDQRGRVWLSAPSGVGFDGGSLTPLLIDTRD
jgi:hypothetical protein